ADDAARKLDALAFTRGSDIYFRSGAYDPESEPGKRLLAHELAHVVQQRPGINREVRRRPAGRAGAGGVGAGAVIRRAAGSKPKGADSGSGKKKPKGTATTFEIPKDLPAAATGKATKKGEKGKK